MRCSAHEIRHSRVGDGDRLTRADPYRRHRGRRHPVARVRATLRNVMGPLGVGAARTWSWQPVRRRDLPTAVGGRNRRLEENGIRNASRGSTEPAPSGHDDRQLSPSPRLAPTRFKQTPAPFLPCAGQSEPEPCMPGSIPPRGHASRRKISASNYRCGEGSRGSTVSRSDFHARRGEFREPALILRLLRRVGDRVRKRRV